MIAIPFTPVTSTAQLVAINAADEPAWSAAVTYAQSAIVSRNKRKWVSLQAGNTGNNPQALASTFWVDDGPSNQWAMFDTSVQTATTRAGGLQFTLATGRVTAIGLMGLIGNDATITVRDGLNGPVIFTNTKTLASSDGSYYGFAFNPPTQLSDATWDALPGSTNGHITITITGSATTACSMCVFGRQVFVGRAQYGFSNDFEDRGQQYLDRFLNPVTVERGFSRGASGTLIVERHDYGRLMAFLASVVQTPCLWVAAPGQEDLVAANVFGRFGRAVTAINGFSEITLGLDISGYR